MPKKDLSEMKTIIHIFTTNIREKESESIPILTSHGDKNKPYGNPLLSRVKRQLKLDALSQVLDLLKCPMSGKGYNHILKDKSLIK